MKIPPVSDSTSLGSRRRFLKTAALAAAAPLGFPAITRCASPNSRLQHCCIGVGGMMGGTDFQNFKSHPMTDVAAICDVDANFLGNAAKEVPGARKYRDWREMLATEGDKIDSVNVTVPDHMHAAIAMSAIRAGKHVYCQKPMCHDVAEVRALTEAVAKPGIVTQLGTQHASGIGDRMAVEWLRKGVIGKVKNVYLCSNRSGSEAYRLEGPRPAAGEAVPESLLWDLWLGTAPTREFASNIYHPSLWRAWLDFGTGWSGDIGCHIFDAAWKGLNMGKAMPKSVIAKVDEGWKNSPERRADTWSRGNHITWVLPGNDLTEKDEITFEWFDGEFYPPEDVRALYPGQRYPEESSMFIGTEGALLLPHGGGPLLLPGDKFKEVERPKPAARNHYHHFADACLGGEMCESHFGQSGPMTEAILLGTVAIRNPETKLDWDGAALKFTNSEAATALVRRKYRDGWSIEGLG